MNKKNKNNVSNVNPLSKITYILVTILLSIIILTSAIFGFYSSVKNRGPNDNSINPYIEFQANIEKNDDISINQVANSIYKTLDFLGEYNSEVYTIGSNSIKIISPISSYSKNNENVLIDEMNNSLNNQDYINEIQKLITTLFYNSNLDFRTTKGTPIFINNNGKEWRFNSDISNENENEEEANSYYLRNSNKVINFFDSAKLNYDNGKPYIQLKIKKESGTNGYINMFKDWYNYYSTLNSGDNNENYITWFDYDYLEKIAIFLDSNYDAEKGLYENYLADGNPPSWIRPFYLCVSSVSPMDSKFQDIIKIKGDLSEFQARYFVNKINNNNLYKFNELSLRLVMEEKSSNILKYMGILFIIIIIVIMFLFSWYFGLLGLISSLLYLLSMVFLSIILSSASIVITGIGLLSLLISSLVGGLFFFIALKVYKNKNMDKLIKPQKRFFEKFSLFNKQSFPMTIIFILIIYFISLILQTNISISLLIIIISILISYIVSSIIQLPILFLFDLLTKFTYQDFEKKWNIINGKNKNLIKINSKLNIKNINKKSLILSISSVLTILLTLILGGISFSFTGSISNSNLYGREKYQYLVIDTNDKKINLINDSDIDESGNYGTITIKNYYNEAYNNLKNVKNVFVENGINVNNISIVRNDFETMLSLLSEISSNSDDSLSTDSKYLSSFGYSIYSNKKIDKNLMSSINNDLSNLSSDTSNIEANYKLKETGSIDKNLNVSALNNFTHNNSIKKGFISLLILIAITSLFIIFIGGWGLSLSSLLSSLLESIFSICPFFIFYIPYTIFIWVPIITMLSLSSLLKVKIIQNIKNEEVSDENIWIRNSKKNIFLIPIIGLSFSIFSLFLIPIYNWIFVLSLIIISIWTSIVIYISQKIFFPFTSKLFNNFRNKIKDNKIKEDIKKSKDDNIGIDEEYVEGVNM